MEAAVDTRELETKVKDIYRHVAEQPHGVPLRVKDVDAVFKRAIDAGGSSVQDPEDHLR